MTSASEFGVRIAGVGSATPEKVLTNADLEKILDTSDAWIQQRTGIRQRQVVDPERGESTFSLARDALGRAMSRAQIEGSDLDLVILASVTAEMTCPSTSCRVAAAVGAGTAGAFDLVAACCGFVYALNIAETLIRSGRYHTIGIIGCDTMTTVADYEERSVSILFGDAAGAAVLTRDADPTVGCLHQTMNADGSTWETLYLPRSDRDVPEWDRDNPIRIGYLRMNGREVYKFAVNKFREVIEESLTATGLSVDQVSQFICHQSNIRIIEAAKNRLKLPDEKVYINIDRYGNSSAGSVGLCFDQLWQAGKVKRGDNVVFVAFGGGLTWSSSVWRL